jgi:hypothetical protein
LGGRHVQHLASSREQLVSVERSLDAAPPAHGGGILAGEGPTPWFRAS